MVLDGSSFSWVCSGDSEADAARFSRSSRRRFNFLPVAQQTLETRLNLDSEPEIMLTVVTLGDSVLNATTLSQIGYLGPIFVRVGVGTESTACPVIRRSPRAGRVTI